ncbi:ABC transporter permease [Pseudomonas fluorescens]|uniref:ABC transporter permease n=1 Tax=Pseudomonas fluorescens TaxID=294 RepID=A0A1T2Y1X3_PSEFL|nr:ABC transporter permease [Pseudomonas fluorescens]OPA86046.1 ABC transporter permease [Pseudomonas fluorescens]
MTVVNNSEPITLQNGDEQAAKRTKIDKKTLSAYWLASPPLVFLLVFFLVPSVLLLVASFWTAKTFSMEPAASLASYARALGASGFYDSLWIALQNGFWTALLSTVISAPVAYYIVYRTRSNAVLYLALVSWFSSYLVRVYAWRSILGTNGVINSTLMHFGLIDQPMEWLVFSKFSVVLTLVHIMLPFTLLLLVSGLRDIKRDYLEAAADLGAGGVTILWRVIMPMAHKSIVSSFMFTFVLAASDYVTPQLLGGRDAMTTGLVIANQFRSVGNWPLGAAMAYLLLIVFMLVYALLLAVLRVANLAPGKRYHD